MALAARKQDTKTNEATVEQKVEVAKTETKKPEAATTQAVEVKVEAPKVEAPALADPHAEERAKFVKMTTQEVWNFFGGQDARGNINKAIRHLTAIGFDRASVAKITGKRYQHVRNVLVEDARAKTEAENRLKAKTATVTK
jgi:hypothetical protein